VSEPTVEIDPEPAGTLLAPVEGSSRIAELDILRGFAILGIALVNIYFFAWPLDVVIDPQWSRFVDRITAWGVDFFVSGKFYTLFSLLFGIGFGIQIARLRERGLAAGRWFVRRMVVLLLFGALHVALLWYGDILSTYALLGLVLLLFRNSESPQILKFAVLFWLAPIAFVLAALLLIAVSSAIPGIGEELSRQAEEDRIATEEAIELAIERYRSPEWGTVARQRFADFVRSEKLGLLGLPSVLSMFLAGLWLVQSRIVFELAARREWLRRVLIASLVIGIPANLFAVVAAEIGDPNELSLATALSVVFHLVGGPALCFAYASGIVLLVGAGSRWLHRLAPVGRMALTNYLLQSVVLALLFYGYGLGWFGRVYPLQMVGIVLVLYAAQLVASTFWMGRFRYGPAEWLWRAGTYGRRALGTEKKDGRNRPSP
jgi:uncharacterized protein